MFQYDGKGEAQDKVDNKAEMDGPVKLIIPNRLMGEGEEGEEKEELVPTEAGRLIRLNKKGD